MIHMRQPFFSLATASIFLVLAILSGGSAISGQPIEFADVVFTQVPAYMMTGLMFIMAYFALVHLKHK